MEKDTLYYDGQCPICNAEMGKLKKLSGGKIHLQDIHTLYEYSNIPDKTELMEVLHLQTKDGRWLKGLDANIQAWQHTPLRYFWKLLGLPGIRVLTEAAYEVWLKWRKRNLKAKQKH